MCIYNMSTICAYMTILFVCTCVRVQGRSQSARFNFRGNGYGKPFGQQNGYWKKSRHARAVDEEDLMEEEGEELEGSVTVVSGTNHTEESEEELGRLKNFRISKHTRHLLKGTYVHGL